MLSIQPPIYYRFTYLDSFILCGRGGRGNPICSFVVTERNLEMSMGIHGNRDKFGFLSLLSKIENFT